VSAHYAFLLSGRTLKGSLFGGWRPKSDLPSLVDKYADKVLMKTSQEKTVSKGEK
jgi:alcohol dehydrogenase